MLPSDWPEASIYLINDPGGRVQLTVGGSIPELVDQRCLRKQGKPVSSLHPPWILHQFLPGLHSGIECNL